LVMDVVWVKEAVMIRLAAGPGCDRLLCRRLEVNKACAGIPEE